MKYLIWYLWFCLAMGVGTYLFWVGNDIINGPDSKLGYAYNSFFTLICVGMLGLPIVNLYFIPWWIYLFWLDYQRRNNARSV